LSALAFAPELHALTRNFALLVWLLPKRIRSAWGLLAVTAFGVLAAVTIMALGAMYSQGLAEAGLRHSLAVTSPTVINTQIVVRNRPLGPEDYSSLRTDIEQIIEDDVGYLRRDQNRFAKMLPTLPFVQVGAPFGISDVPLGRPFFITEFEEHSRVVEGSWPSPTVGRDAAACIDLSGGCPRIEGVLGLDTSRLMGWGVGKEAWLVVYPGQEEQPPEYIGVEIVGIVEPVDPREEYWMGSADYFRMGDWEGRPVAPIYVNEQAFFDGIGQQFPTLVGDYGWFLYINPDVITAPTVQQTRDDLTALETDINSRFPRSYVLTGLENSRDTGLLATYQRELTLARAPLILFISLVVVVILYFLALAVGLLAGARSAESSMLRSRGASTGQVGGLLAVGEGLIVVAATAIGPLLAWGLGSLLLLETINPATRAGAGETPLDVSLSWQMYAMAAIGGLLSLAVLAVAGGSLARLGILDFLRARARPPSAPWLQRYYFDVIAVVALAVLVWQIRQRGGFVEAELTGRGPALDPSLLLAPSAALLTLAFLLLRALPWLMTGTAWVSRQLAPAWVSLSLRRMARHPLPYASLTVVVTLAAALGVFAGTFQTTLARSEADQANHRVGGDITLGGTSFIGRTEQQRVDQLKAIDGVEAVSPIIRESVGFVDGPFQRGTVLGVDPLTIGSVSWWRDDLVDGEATPLDTLVAPLRRTLSPETAGVEIPQGTREIGVWVRRDDAPNVGASVPLPSYRLWLRIGSDRGFYRNLEMGMLNQHQTGWHNLRSPLPEESATATADDQWRVVAIYISGDSFARTPPGGLSFDGVTVYGADLPPDGEVIEGFEDIGPWIPLPQAGNVPDRTERTADAARSGDAGLSIKWEEPLGRSPRGIVIPPGPLPLPAITGPGFTPGQTVRFTVDGYVVPARVTRTVNHFPTLDARRSFVVVSVYELRAWLDQAPGAHPITPDEWWFDVAEGADRERVADEILDVGYRLSFLRDRQETVDLASRNPLAGGAWDALTGIGLAALALAVALALCAHAAVAVREQRVDMSVGAALGIPQWQRIAGLALERAVIGVLGIVVGGLAGWGLARWTLGELAGNASGGAVTPPIVFVAEGPWLVATFLCLVVAAVAAIGLAGAVSSRLRPPEVLREAE
jgi:hypothetical protein